MFAPWAIIGCITKKGARRPIPIPGKLSDDLKDGTLGSILREAGLK